MAKQMPEGKRFKKGQSGNPAGRPKKLPELDALIGEVLGEEKDGMTAAAAILKKWRQMAAQGNLKAGEMLFDRGYGKPKQAHEHSGPDKGPIEVKQWIVEVEPEQPKPQYDPKNSSM